MHFPFIKTILIFVRVTKGRRWAGWEELFITKNQCGWLCTFGGELAAAVVADAIYRLIRRINDETSAWQISSKMGLLAPPVLYPVPQHTMDESTDVTTFRTWSQEVNGGDFKHRFDRTQERKTWFCLHKDESGKSDLKSNRNTNKPRVGKSRKHKKTQKAMSDLIKIVESEYSEAKVNSCFQSGDTINVHVLDPKEGNKRYPAVPRKLLIQRRNPKNLNGETFTVRKDF